MIEKTNMRGVKNIKKKLLTILMTMCMVSVLSACGEKGHKFADITIEDEKYNLSQDFIESVKGLFKNGYIE